MNKPYVCHSLLRTLALLIAIHYIFFHHLINGLADIPLVSLFVVDQTFETTRGLVETCPYAVFVLVNFHRVCPRAHVHREELPIDSLCWIINFMLVKYDFLLDPALG
jgi:hypothetical protein